MTNAGEHAENWDSVRDVLMDTPGLQKLIELFTL